MAMAKFEATQAAAPDDDWALLDWANALLTRASTKHGEERTRLLRQAIERVHATNNVHLAQELAQLLHQLALAEPSSEERERLFVLASENYKYASRLLALPAAATAAGVNPRASGEIDASGASHRPLHRQQQQEYPQQQRRSRLWWIFTEHAGKRGSNGGHYQHLSLSAREPPATTSTAHLHVRSCHHARQQLQVAAVLCAAPPPQTAALVPSRAPLMPLSQNQMNQLGNVMTDSGTAAPTQDQRQSLLSSSSTTKPRRGEAHTAPPPSSCAASSTTTQHPPCSCAATPGPLANMYFEWGSLMYDHAKLKSGHTAVSLYKRAGRKYLKGFRLCPTLSSYRDVLSAMAQGSDWGFLHPLLAECVAEGSVLDLATLMRLVQTHTAKLADARAGHIRSRSRDSHSHVAALPPPPAAPIAVVVKEEDGDDVGEEDVDIDIDAQHFPSLTDSFLSKLSTAIATHQLQQQQQRPSTETAAPVLPPSASGSAATPSTTTLAPLALTVFANEEGRPLSSDRSSSITLVDTIDPVPAATVTNASQLRATSPVTIVTLKLAGGSVSDTAFVLGGGFRNLQYLDLRDCKAISDMTLVALSRTSPHLRYLNVSGCMVGRSRAITASTTPRIADVVDTDGSSDDGGDSRSGSISSSDSDSSSSGSKAEHRNTRTLGSYKPLPTSSSLPLLSSSSTAAATTPGSPPRKPPPTALALPRTSTSANVPVGGSGGGSARSGLSPVHLQYDTTGYDRKHATKMAPSTQHHHHAHAHGGNSSSSSGGSGGSASTAATTAASRDRTRTLPPSPTKKSSHATTASTSSSATLASTASSSNTATPVAPKSVAVVAAAPAVPAASVDANATPQAPSTTVTSSGQSTLLQLLPFESLEVLHMAECPALTDDSLKLILWNCPRLQELSLSGSMSFTSTGLVNCFRRVPISQPLPVPKAPRRSGVGVGSSGSGTSKASASNATGAPSTSGSTPLRTASRASTVRAPGATTATSTGASSSPASTASTTPASSTSSFLRKNTSATRGGGGLASPAGSNAASISSSSPSSTSGHQQTRTRPWHTQTQINGNAAAAAAAAAAGNNNASTTATSNSTGATKIPISHMDGPLSPSHRIFSLEFSIHPDDAHVSVNTSPFSSPSVTPPNLELDSLEALEPIPAEDVRPTKLKIVDLSKCAAVEDNAIRHLVASCGATLEQLRIGGLPRLTRASLRTVATSCPQLRQLKLSRFPTLDDESVQHLAQRCPLLEHFEVSHAHAAFTNASLIYLAKACAYLSTVGVAHCKQISDVAVQELATRCWRTLRSLKLSGLYKLTNAGIEAIAARCSSLVLLELDGCENVSDPAVLALARGCPDLRVLTIRSLKLTSACLVQLFHLASLQRVNLARLSNQVTDAVLNSIAASCRTTNHSLVQLNLSWCTRFSHNALQHLAVACSTSLRSVDFTECKLSDESVIALAEACPQLEHVILDAGTKITDTAVIKLAGSCGASLRSLTLSGCYRVTDVGIVKLSRCAPQLRYLDLSWCYKLTDASLVRIFRDTPRMQVLLLNGCRLLTDSAMDELVHRPELQPGLGRLDVECAPLVTRPTIWKLRCARPHLHVSSKGS